MGFSLRFLKGYIRKNKKQLMNDHLYWTFLKGQMKPQEGFQTDASQIALLINQIWS